jgi:hypothetical protein
MHEMCSIKPPKFPRAVAIQAVREILDVFSPACMRVVVAGSLRRGKGMVGDAEILFIPHTAVQNNLLGEVEQSWDLTDKALELLIAQGVIAKRLNKTGYETWGPSNKLAVHVSSGVPIDFFRATVDNWFNYLVCRTGPADSNVRIATAARQKGLHCTRMGRGSPICTGASTASPLNRTFSNSSTSLTLNHGKESETSAPARRPAPVPTCHKFILGISAGLRTPAPGRALH